MIYAAKTVAKASLKSSKTKEKLLAEIKIHKSMHHPNIVQFVDCFEDDDNVYILLEICENQSLMEMLRARSRLTEEETKYYIVQILGAVRYMHKRRVLHRDLKLGNIFIGDNMDVKIGDFGLATVLASDSDRRRTICGTPNYIAPEVLFGKKVGHSYEADIWSVGIILYTMLFGKPPFQTKEIEDIYDRIANLSYSFPEKVKVSEDAKDLIRKLLVTDPVERLSIEKVLEHPFFEYQFPAMVPSFALTKKPIYAAMTEHDARKNFINCQVQAKIRLAESTEVASTDVKPIKIDERAATSAQNSQTENGPAAVLPTSLSPASTKDKYKMVIVPRKSGLDLKQQQQQKLKLTGEYAGKAVEGNKQTAEQNQDRAYDRHSASPRPRWTRAVTALATGNRNQTDKQVAVEQRVTRSATAPPKTGQTNTASRTAVAAAAAAAAAPAASAVSGRTTHDGKSMLYRTLKTLTIAINSYESKETLAPAQSSPRVPAVFISKWVDFSDKYGLAYQTSESNDGVLFRNGTVLLMNPENETYLMLDKDDTTEKPLVCKWTGKAIYPSTENASEHKVIRLINTFHRYMQDHLQKSNYGIQRASDDLSVNPVFVTYYERQPEYVMLCLNNGTFQFNFPDHMKLIVSSGASQIDLIDNDQRLHTWSIQEALAFTHRAQHKKLVSDPAYTLIHKLAMCRTAVKKEYNSL
ncbi:polo kinase CDC5 [Sugiyamaella lignohabitans]|uniref:Polo kinase CDC5 n=1 Tax=Sugiyamaella lignohabitans TaxID=796027 RepID=A0A167C5F0_9ASCO|nr:polo kinase CDC5 [Sugiyamaella lignohabitans]ANB11240.1 polo kinase CDC5 [Sugiyamaella lignohabitans]